MEAVHTVASPAEPMSDQGTPADPEASVASPT